jgi:hypothetical protein
MTIIVTQVKFKYCEKARKFETIVVAFSEYINFLEQELGEFLSSKNITQIRNKAIFYDFPMNFDKSGSDFGGG